MAKPNFTLPNKPAIKSGSILSYNYTDDFTFVPAPLTFNRDSAATRVNEKGLIEDVGYFGPELVQNSDFSEIGEELVTNGDFDTDSNWTKGTGWSISGGSANCDGTQVANSLIYQSGVLVSANSFKCEITISDYQSGVLRLVLGGGGSEQSYSANGTYTFYGTKGSDNNLYLSANSDFIGSIDNISVKEVGQNWDLTDGATITDNGVRILSDGTYQRAAQYNILTVGKQYKVQYEILENNGGNLKLQTSLGIIPIPSTVGIHTVYGEALQTFLTIERNGACDITITNVSVIEVLGDKPRIDYSDSLTEPSLLLEPQSTNLIEYSEDFNGWTKTGNTTISATNILSPSGQNNATNITGLDGTGSNDLRFFPSGFNSANKTLCFSVYLKGSGTLRLQMSNGVDQGIQQSITLTDNWKRHQVSGTFNSTSSGSQFHCNIDDSSSSTATSYNVWGAQLEELSYATSYIPTTGSTATRLGETANNAGDVNVFNSEEGVLYAEIAALVNDSNYKAISVSDGSHSNRVQFSLRLNTIAAFVSVGGSSQYSHTETVTNILDYHKIALVYKQNNYKLFVNGTLVDSSASGNTFPQNTLTELSFTDGIASNFYGNARYVAVFKEALTDRELEILTIQ